MLALIPVFDQSFLGKVCCDPIFFKWVACFIVIWLHLAFGCLIVLALSFGLSLNRLFLTLFVCNFGSLRNRSHLSLASPSSCLSSLSSNHAQLCVTVLDCLGLHQAVVCWICWAIVHDFGWLVNWLVGRLLFWSVSTSIGWCFWYCSRIYFPERFKT